MATTLLLFAWFSAAPGRVLADGASDETPCGRSPQRPNFIVVLCDDLGYGDLGCYGHPKIQTPHVDRFAAEGLRLTDCYASAPNCSPSRAGLMTGRTPFRVGIHNWIPTFSPMHLPRHELTIATLLQRAGYATCHAGKWHLNGRFNLPGQPQPSEHGFDHWFGTQNNALPSHENPDNFVRNGIPVGYLEGYSAQLVAGEAIDWLTRLRDPQKPFFLFVCFHEPHEPIATDRRFRELYEAESGSTLPAHHGNVTQMDDAFGRLMQAVDDLRLRDSTLVFFTSDNGPAITGWHPHGSAGPLRDKKGSVYEGGIRVPGIVRWPGHTKPGSVSDQPVSGLDVLPTLCAAAGLAVPTDRRLDGVSVLPLLQGKPWQRTRPLYWQFNRARGEPKVAMRDGDWKILARLTGPPLAPSGAIVEEEIKLLKSAELIGLELYNLRDDIAESQELSKQHPDRLASMTRQLREQYREVRDASPLWPAWNWPRYEGQRINTWRRAVLEQKSIVPGG